MNAHAQRSRANRARILSAATRNIAETAFGRITRPGIMAGTGLRTGTLELHFPSTTRLLATICHAHAHALLEAAGCHDPLDPTPRSPGRHRRPHPRLHRREPRSAIQRASAPTLGRT